MCRSVWLALALAGLWAGRVAAAGDVAAGDAALQRFDLDGAVTAYRRAHDRAPQDYEATWKLARALVDQGTMTRDWERQKKLYLEAEPLARAAVRLNPKDGKGHTYLAIAVGKLGLFEGGRRKVELSKEVKIEAEAALAADPKEDIAWHVLGVWNREMVDLNWALKKFAEWVYGKFPPASLTAAVTDLRRATELAPNVVAHHVELGITLAAARQWPEARTELERGLALPKAWVTDNYYRSLAKPALERVNHHLQR